MSINQDNNPTSNKYKNLSLIVATDQENGIGKNNQLLWHLPNDLKFFKKTTSGHAVIMGRKTFDSIGKPLPNRRNIIITRKEDLKIEGVEVLNSLANALKACSEEEQPFIIGGGEIYREALPFVDHIYLTKVHHQFNADTFFPTLDAINWEVTFKEDHYKDDKHAFDYSFLILKRH